MSHNSVTDELESLGQQFQEWRRKQPHSKYPKSLWDQALELTTRHGFSAVAKLTGYPPSYLRRKSERRSVSITREARFVEVKTESPIIPQEVKLRIQKSGIMAELSFYGDIEQVIPLILPVVQGEGL